MAGTKGRIRPASIFHHTICSQHSIHGLCSGEETKQQEAEADLEACKSDGLSLEVQVGEMGQGSQQGQAGIPHLGVAQGQLAQAGQACHALHAAVTHLHVHPTLL